jgi:hypothetical protein
LEFLDGEANLDHGVKKVDPGHFTWLIAGEWGMEEGFDYFARTLIDHERLLMIFVWCCDFLRLVHEG